MQLYQCRGEEGFTGMDITTPLNAHLSAFYKRSFAYYTVRERLPRILTQTIDILVRNKDGIAKEYGEIAYEEIKEAISKISKLKYEIMTNKQMRNFTSTTPDAKFYNDYLAKEPNASYFTTIFLHTECYMYRRLREVFEETASLKTYDPFRIQKQESFVVATEPIANVSKHLLMIVNASSSDADTKENFVNLLKLNLWGNKCDLSLSNGIIENALNPFETLTQFEPNILADDSEKVWEAVSSNKGSNIVDIIFDNAGYEVFTDFCLADFMISKNLASKVRMYVKSIPWFVSDVTRNDFNWFLEQMKASDNKDVHTLGSRWTDYVSGGKWVMVEDDFFTLPVDFSYMPKVAPNLYAKLSEAKFVLIKGDLNYRKLFGEKNWDPTTPCREATSGFGPAPFCILRTIKCDTVCGLRPNISEELTKQDPKWMGTGNYGVIQFVKNVPSVDKVEL